MSVKLWPGKSEQQKQRLADRITRDVMDVLNYGEESVSLAIEEIPAADWAEKVYKPEIIKNSKTLTRNQDTTYPNYPEWTTKSSSAPIRKGIKS